jgi:hypothetical protein
MNTQAILLQAFAQLKSVFSDSVVSVAVSVSDNVTVTVNGLRSNAMIARALSKNGLKENIDESVWIPSAEFTDITALRGRTATLTKGSDVLTMRILQTTEHALGGLVKLQFGDYDRTVA